MKKIFFLLLCILFIQKIFSQDLTLYTMNPGAYVSWLRPSIVPDKKYYLEVPFLSSFSWQVRNTAFNYHDLYVKRPDDSITFDINNVLSKMNDNNFIALNFSESLFSFGMRIKKYYVSFNVNERLDFGFAFPKELIDFIYKGNGPYIGKTLEFKNVSLEMTHFREYSFGVSTKLSEKLSSGIHIKYLYGMENVSTVNKNLSLTTNEEDYSLYLVSDISVNTSTYFNRDNGYKNLNVSHYILGLNNRGIAVDMGATYKASDKFELNGSLLDLGFIKWNENLKNFYITNGKYEFNGIDLQGFVNDTAKNVQHVLDSLSAAYKPQEKAEAYKSYLHSRVFLSGSYKFGDLTTASALVNLQFFNGMVSPAYSLSARQKLGKVFSLAMSYSYVNNSFDNLGIGFQFQSKIMNVFFAAENILGTIQPANFRTAGVRGGVAFNWGSVNDN